MKRRTNIVDKLRLLYQDFFLLFEMPADQEKIQLKCLRLRDDISKTQQRKRKIQHNENKTKGLNNELVKLKIEFYQLEMHKQLDQLLKENDSKPT
jgi:hypothetical protein